MLRISLKENLNMRIDSEENTSRRRVLGSPIGLMLTAAYSDRVELTLCQWMAGGVALGV